MAWPQADTSSQIAVKDQAVNDLDALLTAWRLQIEDVLDSHMPAEPPADLIEAGRHSLLGKGKRVRALLALACVHDLGADPDLAMTGACAIEMVHAASLILDDMPCMDDAMHRRGRETTHLAYGQSTAILSAIGLMPRLRADWRRLPAPSRSPRDDGRTIGGCHRLCRPHGRTT